MNNYPQLTQEEIIDFKGIREYIKNLGTEEEQNKFIKNFPSLENIVYEFGHIYAETIKMTRHLNYATRKRPTEARQTLKLLGLFDEKRLTATDTIIMEKCAVLAMDNMFMAGFEIGDISKLIINKSGLAPVELQRLIDGKPLKSVYIKNSTINEEVDISEFWPYLYDVEELYLDLKNLKFGPATAEMFRMYPRTKPLKSMVLHNVPDSFPLQAFCDYISEVPVHPELVALHYENKDVRLQCIPMKTFNITDDAILDMIATTTCVWIIKKDNSPSDVNMKHPYCYF